MDNCLLFVADTCHSAVILPPPSLLAEALLIIEAKMLDPFFPSFLSSYGMSMGKVRSLTSGTWRYVGCLGMRLFFLVKRDSWEEIPFLFAWPRYVSFWCLELLQPTKSQGLRHFGCANGGRVERYKAVGSLMASWSNWNNSGLALPLALLFHEIITHWVVKLLAAENIYPRTDCSVNSVCEFCAQPCFQRWLRHYLPLTCSSAVIALLPH